MGMLIGHGSIWAGRARQRRGTLYFYWSWLELSVVCILPILFLDWDNLKSSFSVCSQASATGSCGPRTSMWVSTKANTRVTEWSLSKRLRGAKNFWFLFFHSWKQVEKEQSLRLRLGAKMKKGRKVALRIEHLFARGCPMDFACAISFNPQMLIKFIVLRTYYVVSTVPSILIDCFKD